MIIFWHFINKMVYWWIRIVFNENNCSKYTLNSKIALKHLMVLKHIPWRKWHSNFKDAIIWASHVCVLCGFQSLKMLDNEETTDNELRTKFNQRWNRTPSGDLYKPLRAGTVSPTYTENISFLFSYRSLSLSPCCPVLIMLLGSFSFFPPSLWPPLHLPTSLTVSPRGS